MQGHLRALTRPALTGAVLALAACNGGAGAPSGAASQSSGGASAPLAPSAVPGLAGSSRAAAVDPFEPLGAEAALAARQALSRYRASGLQDRAAYLAYRRALARGAPFIALRGFAGEALLGAGPNDEIGGAAGRLDLALATGDAKEAAEQAGAAERALQLVEDALSRKPVSRAQAAVVLPKSAFWLGAVLAGSKPGMAATQDGAIADAQGWLDAVERGLAAYSFLVSPSKEFGAAAETATLEIGILRAALDAAAPAGALSGRAALVVHTGKLGAALRALLGPSAWTPYAPAVGPADQPVTVLTVPKLRRAEPAGGASALAELAAKGEALFFDKSLSAGGKRSCATCHAPEKAYTDGKRTAESLDPGTPILRNAPTLLYASLHAAQFWDGRALTSEAQAAAVLHSKAEMGSPDRPSPGGAGRSIEDVTAALAAFQAEKLAPASSPMDRFARGDGQALSDEERAGFDVFAGKGRCARCHAPPLFGGALPPDFSTAVFAALGVPKGPSDKALDADLGRGAITRRALDAGSFKTPTLRNVGRTAPFFHHGAFPTLESVVDFYDKGGGAALGLAVPNQDPDVRPLSLTAAERRALLAFLRGSLADAAPR